MMWSQSRLYTVGSHDRFGFSFLFSETNKSVSHEWKNMFQISSYRAPYRCKCAPSLSKSTGTKAVYQPLSLNYKSRVSKPPRFQYAELLQVYTQLNPKMGNCQFKYPPRNLWKWPNHTIIHGGKTLNITPTITNVFVYKPDKCNQNEKRLTSIKSR